MKTLDHYLTTDEIGYQLIARKCSGWKQMGHRDMTSIIWEILMYGGLIGIEPRPGVHVLGNMNNPEIGLSGDIWVTAEVVECGESYILTSSGSEYRLLRPFARYEESTPRKVNVQPVEYIHSIPRLPDGASVDEIFKDPLRYCPR